MKRYLTVIPYEFTALVFIVPAKSKQDASLKAKQYYKDQFGDDAPEKIGVYIIPDKDTAYKDGVFHITNIPRIVQTVEANRAYNYTPSVEYA